MRRNEIIVVTIVILLIVVFIFLLFVYLIFLNFTNPESQKTIINNINRRLVTQNNNNLIIETPNKIESFEFQNLNINCDEIEEDVPVDFGCDIKTLGDSDIYIVAATIKKPSGKMYNFVDRKEYLDGIQTFDWSYLPVEIGKHYIVFGIWDKDKKRPIISSSWELNFTVVEFLDFNIGGG